MSDDRIPVLDHGYVRLDGVLGTDQDIARIARVSTGKGNKSEEADKRFIDYLMRHQHWSPFEMPVMRFEVKMPIFVARQWVRHRTHSMNEYSGRYSEMPEETFLPDVERIQTQGTDNRQGSGEPLFEGSAALVRYAMEHEQELARKSYQNYLNAGVSKELSRINLPLSQYTIFYWQQNLRNLLATLHLRLDEHAQPEARAYAQVMAGYVEKHFPWTYAAWTENVLMSRTFSRTELRVLGDLLYALEHFYVLENVRDQSRDAGTLDDAVETSATSLGMNASRVREVLAKINYARSMP